MVTWVLTGSPENFAATREHGFTVIGLKERRHSFAQQIEPGDRIVFYLTKVGAFGGAVRVTGELFEDRATVWPGKPGKADAYPWRFPTEPEIVLEEDDWVPAEEVKDHLEPRGLRPLTRCAPTPGYGPPEHWKLAFQGQIRKVSDNDAALLVDRLSAAGGVAA